MFGRRARESVAPEDLHAAILELHRALSPAGVECALLESGKRLLGAEHASFFRYEPRWRDLAGTPLGGPPGGGEIRFPSGQGILGWVAEACSPLVSTRPGREKAYLEAVDAVAGEAPRTLAALPVAEGEHLLGVAAFANAEASALTDEAAAALGMLAEQTALALARTKRLEETRRLALSMASAFGNAVDAKFASTGGHSRRTAELAVRLGEAMGLDADALEALQIAAHLHNLGRIDSARPPESGAADQESYHLRVTEATLRNIDFPPRLAVAREIALSYHEAVDGSGHPRGARGEELSIGTRILKVANAFDRLRFIPQADGEVFSDEEALAHLKENAGRLFDAEVVRVFDERRLWDSEKRRHARLVLASSVEVSLYDEHGRLGPSVESEVLDISEGGLQFRSERPLPVWALVHLVIHLPADSVEALAKIARVVPDGQAWRVGVSFLWHGRAEG